MPVFRSGFREAPTWCEVEFFEILRLATGESRTLRQVNREEQIVLVSGSCSVGGKANPVVLHQGEPHPVAPDDFPYVICCESGPAMTVRICGRWGQTRGSCGVFDLRNSREPCNHGDPVGYARGTAFDNHYHDCDEYWIIVEGQCVAVSEGRVFILGPGDCLVTGRGYHHDIPLVVETVKGMYFEGTLEASKRNGHLWEHRDGPAEPVADRR